MNSKLVLFRRLSVTLLIGSAGGLAATALNLPVSWLLGSAITIAVANLCGVRIFTPDALRNVVFFVLGIQAGSGVTPDVVNQLALWPISFAIQMLGVLGVVVATNFFLQRVFGWDKETALFASLPGAMSFIIAAASETKADMTRIVTVQSIRILLLIGALTPALAWLEGGNGVSAGLRGGIIGAPWQYAVLGIVCLTLAWIGVRSRIPGGLILGALLGSALMHGTEIAPVAIPQWIAAPALIMLGCVIGGRLRHEDRKAMLQLLPASLGALVIGLVISALAGLLAVSLLPLEVGKVALAYAPGALEALTVLAFQFNLDPAYVAAHHVVRFIGLALLIPLLASRLPQKRGDQTIAKKDAAQDVAARDTEDPAQSTS